MTEKIKRRQVRLRRGDMFEFQVRDGRLGYGMVVIPGGVFYAVFFRQLHDYRPDPVAIASDAIALVGTTMDGKLYHGDWHVIARDLPLPAGIPYPNWKVGIDGHLHTVDFEGSNPTPIRATEVELLDYRFSRTPLCYVDALEAVHGLQPWQENFEKLTPAYAAQRMTRPRVAPPLSLRSPD